VIAQTLPPEACSIIVPLIADKTPLCLLGISFSGSDAELSAVQAAASAQGLKFLRSAEPGQPAELKVVFLPGTPTNSVAAMFAGARAGRFGGVKYNILVALQSSAADGIELQKEAGYIDPSQVVLPGQ
jgi:hypothetical protein